MKLAFAGALAVATALAAPAGAQTPDHGWQGHAEAPRYQGAVFPPWQHGANNDAVKRGFDITVPEADSLADFHGDLTDPKLVLYVGGNYFFAMAPLVAAFETADAEYKGHVFWETLPPGFLEKQMQAGGTVTSGNMTWTVRADAYFAGLVKVRQMIGQGVLTGPAIPYATNTLAIMVAKGNPAHVTGLADLGKPAIRLSMPNPAFEGIARQIQASLAKAGGQALADMVYRTKVADGSTVLTHIHHRQTPLFLMQGVADAGVTWQSEVVFQQQAGHPIEQVTIPAAQNTTAIYAGAEVKGAMHPEAAQRWLAFIRSPAALAIFERYGFKPYVAASR
ncbi:substrate-binding domain-containing protein [Rhodopila sp.]|uniref:substrate-binding domain-containing protein n=1 Tax=Rhodopila sp. TaxID=2480087 RepID=UPI003D0B1623